MARYNVCVFLFKCNNYSISRCLQLLLRMETLYFPADAVIARAAHYLKDTERNALANQVENDYTPSYLLLEWQSFWFFTGDDNNGGKSGNESTH